MKIVTIGAVTKDLFLRSDALPTIEQKTDLGELQQFLAIAYGSKINLTSLATGYGGGALNSGISFNRAGYDVTCYSRMGNDQIGSEIRNWLLHHAITAEQVTIDPTLPSAQSFILPCANNDRIIFTYRGAYKSV
ncbi:carbohydrate kinase family protein, partial [Candidatus Dependentiae bacterium]|nr:carbohydrate kinase family protein [Candidatus Dependentiae bacterium]